MKASSRSDSIVSKKKILKNWNDERDTFAGDASSMGWTDLSKGGSFPYPHRRPLNVEDAEQAIRYIKVITEKYPVQIRYAMAIPLWNRFAQEWCETGDLKKALRGI